MNKVNWIKYELIARKSLICNSQGHASPGLGQTPPRGDQQELPGKFIFGHIQ